MKADVLKIGEFANDYIEIRRDFLDWAPPVTPGGLGSANDDDTRKGHYAAGDRHGKPDHSPSISIEENSHDTPENVTSTEKETLPTVVE